VSGAVSFESIVATLTVGATREIVAGLTVVRKVTEPLAGTPTPKPSLPDTASGIGPNGQPVTVPVELLAVVFLGSLGALALANARARTRRW
jgi:hypothetical protein